MREHFTTQGVNAYLDTPGGLMLAAQHGGRAQAAAALAEAERADRAWRRAVAADRAERYPSRYPSVEDAMRDIPDPVGGASAWLDGSTDDIVRTVRRIDPARSMRNLGEGQPDAVATGYSQGPDGRLTVADTRAPWARD